jgi:very-short-patch-repair endonuclease
VADLGHIAAKIRHLADEQHGHITRTQLLGLGVASRTIGRWIAAGRLIVVHAGVYAVGHREPGPVAAAHAAVLACGDGAVLSHDSAAALWGLSRWPNHPEVSAPRRCDRPGIEPHRSSTLTAGEITVHYGVPVTTPVRTVCDIAPRRTDDQLLKAIDDARIALYLGPDALDEIIRRCPRVRHLIGDSPSRSSLERDWRRFAKRHRLPPHELNVALHGYEVDVHFAAHRLVVELDGWHFHRGPRSFRSDRVRDTVLKDHGIDTIRLTADRLTGGEAARLQRILDNQSQV